MRRAIFLVVMLVASCAYAELQDFENFSLEIPEGWTAIEDGAVVSVSANDGSASLTITTDRPGDMSIEELASEIAREVGGTLPEKDSDDNYSFTFDDGKSLAVITGDEDFYMLIVGTDIEDNGQVGEILDSLEMK